MWILASERDEVGDCRSPMSLCRQPIEKIMEIKLWRITNVSDIFCIFAPQIIVSYAKSDAGSGFLRLFVIA